MKITRAILPMCLLWVGYSAIQWLRASNWAQQGEEESARARAGLTRRRAELANIELTAKDAVPWQRPELQAKRDAITREEIDLRECDQKLSKDSADAKRWRWVVIGMSASTLCLWLLGFWIGARNAPIPQAPETSSGSDRSP
jgi:hypothetical protein